MTDESELLHADLTQKIIGAAMTVSNALCPGLGERLYENALMIELVEQGIFVEQQLEFPVHYKGRLLGKLRPDLIVDRRVIVDTKTVEGFDDSQIKQVAGYLAITGLQVGLLLNFKFARLHWKRIVRTRSPIPDEQQDPL